MESHSHTSCQECLLGRSVVFCVALLLLCLVAPGTAQTYLNSPGFPAFVTPVPVENGSINVANGNLHIEIPLGVFSQRSNFQAQAKVIYNSRIWYIATNGTSQYWAAAGDGGYGWDLYNNNDSSKTILYAQTWIPCGASGYYKWSNYSWIDIDGTPRAFPGIVEYTDGSPPSGCTLPTQTTSAYAEDSSGFYMVANTSTADVYMPDGTHLEPPVGSGTGERIDTNGNYINPDSNKNMVDTLGRTPLSVSGGTTYVVLNSQGGTSNYTATYSNITITTAFGVPGVTECCSSPVSVLTAISFPDSTSYQFGYDSYGEVNSITQRTGGKVTYTYTNFTDGYGNINRWLTGRTSSGGTWSYTPAVISTCPSGGQNCQQKTTVTMPSGDTTVYTFTLNTYGAWNTETDEYSGSSTLLRTTTIDYNNLSSGINIQPMRVTVTLPTPGGNISSKKEYTYDQYGNITANKEWKYYSGTPSSSPDREIDYTYTASSSSYVAKNILNKVTSITTKNGAGSQVAQTNISYDSTSLTLLTGVIHHDDTNFGMGNTIRGNPTQISRWVSGTGCSPNTVTCLTTTNYYDTTGQLIKTVDPKSNTVTYSFADKFYNDNGSNPPQSYTPTTATNAYRTQTTLPVSGSLSSGYYFGSGKQAVSTDQNGVSTYSHFVDNLDRPTESYFPDGGWTLTTYSGATSTDTYQGITSTTPGTTCTSCRHDDAVLNDWNLLVQKSLISDPEGQTNVVNSYDTSRRLASTTNPYRSPTDPTYGTTSYAYDGLNRTTQITDPDNNTVHHYYGSAVSSNGGAASQLCATGTYGLGYPELAADEAGHKRQFWYDDHRNIIEADEPDSTNNLTVGTCYKYNVLDHLTNVVQGSESRTYEYDGLSRMTAEVNPESGTTQYYYTTSTGTLCAGDPHVVCRQTDARGITITSSYDAENRLTGKTYSDTTHSVTFSYDQASYNGLTITNGKGRRTGMSDGSGATAWSYDAIGRILAEERTISGVTKTTSYTYNLDGSLATKTYPSGRKITYTVGNAGRALSATDTANSINYATSAKYAPQGALASMVNGNVSGGFAGITLTYGYNNRLQMSSAKASSSNGDVFDLTYSYNLGNGVNNGNVASITNNLNTNRTQLFTYDNLDRVATAKTQGTTGNYCWGQSFGYDRYGNLLTATVTQCSAPSLSLSMNTNNQITNSGFTYDADGNLTADGTNSYTWNAEHRPTAIGGTTYKYDGDYLRVYKSTGLLQWPDETCTIPLAAETDTSGNTTAEYIRFAGQLIAHRDSSGNVFYHYSDHLRSGRVMTNSTGITQQESDFYPFGGELVVTNNVVNHHKFTSKYRDPETAFDYSFYRMYQPNLARWASADPIHGDTSDPQQLNRYNYVENRPVRLADPSGGFLPPCFNQFGFFDDLVENDPIDPFPMIDVPFCPVIPLGLGATHPPNPPTYIFCACHNLEFLPRALGCHYLCYPCSDQHVRYAYFRCGWTDKYAWHSCPDFTVVRFEPGVLTHPTFIFPPALCN